MRWPGWLSRSVRLARPPAPTTWPRLHSLRARLTAGLVVLLAVSCAAVGVAAVLELDGFLTGRLDQQLAQTGTGFPASLEHHGRRDDHDGDEYADTRHQAPGTLGVRLVGRARHERRGRCAPAPIRR